MRKELWEGSNTDRNGRRIYRGRKAVKKTEEELGDFIRRKHKRKKPKNKIKRIKAIKNPKTLYDEESKIGEVVQTKTAGKKAVFNRLPAFVTPIQFSGKQAKFIIDTLIMEKERLILLEEKLPQLKRIYMSDIVMCNKLIERLLMLENSVKHQKCTECLKVKRSKPIGSLQQMYTGFIDPAPRKKAKEEEEKLIIKSIEEEK